MIRLSLRAPLAEQLPGLPEPERWQRLADALAELEAGGLLARREWRAVRDRLEAAVRAAARATDRASPSPPHGSA